jgi:hypothetical protein
VVCTFTEEAERHCKGGHVSREGGVSWEGGLPGMRCGVNKLLSACMN